MLEKENYIRWSEKLDILENKKATQRLLQSCEKCKTTLSANLSATVNVECIVDDFDINGRISRDELEEMAKPLLERAMSTVHRLMADLNFTPEQVSTMAVCLIHLSHYSASESPSSYAM